jgi:hypothetical protein
MPLQVRSSVTDKLFIYVSSILMTMKPLYSSVSLSFIGAMLVLCLSFSSGIAVAHIKNESSQFPDIEFSDARYDIVVLVGAGIIPETPVFEPDLPMTRQDLAIWGALFNNLGPGGETPDTDALAKAALAQGLVESFEGQATYAEINDLFFEGQLSVTEPDAIPSKAEAASFIASMLATPAGVSLLARRGLETGPVGEVSSAESRMNPDGGSSYFVTIGSEELPMYAHGRVANGPTDLLQWQGRNVKRSFIRRQGDFRLWMYIEAAAIDAATLDNTTAPALADADPMSAVQTNRGLLYGLLAGVLALGLILFFKRKRVG